MVARGGRDLRARRRRQRRKAGGDGEGKGGIRMEIFWAVAWNGIHSMGSEESQAQLGEAESRRSDMMGVEGTTSLERGRRVEDRMVGSAGGAAVQRCSGAAVQRAGRGSSRLPGCRTARLLAASGRQRPPVSSGRHGARGAPAAGSALAGF
jgi:hypothetical protein